IFKNPAFKRIQLLEVLDILLIYTYIGHWTVQSTSLLLERKINNMASGHGFSATLEKKLKDLSVTVHSIQGISQWVIHHRKHAKTVVGHWYKELQSGSSNRKLTLLYLANDILQNSRKKGTEYVTEFNRVLPKAFHLVNNEKDESLSAAVSRILSVWEERKVFEDDLIKKYKAYLTAGSSHSHRRIRSDSDAKKRIRDSPPVPKPEELSPAESPPKKREPPEPEELFKRMAAIDRSNSVAADTATQQRIAALPPEVHSSSLSVGLKDKTAVNQLMEKVDEAIKLLSDYTARVEAEVKEREDIHELLDAYIWQQKHLLRETKKKMKDHQGKLEKVTKVRQELQSHLASLPDISKLPTNMVAAVPTIGQELAPLPSAGDLFT
ncbi:hypothetical protein EMCRGX_G031649, partial [Ephydatia muelleri]